MAVKHVEIDQVREDQPRRIIAAAPRGAFPFRPVIFRGDIIFDPAPVVNVVNFADAENGHASRGQHVQHHGLGRIDRIVMPPRGTREISGRAGKGARDDAAHAVGTVEHVPRDFAHAVKFGDRNHLFVRGDLKNAVARGVHDREPGAHMLGAQLFQNFRAAGGLISERRASDGALEPLDQFARKSVRVNGKGAVEPDAGHLPMPGSGVLAGRARRAFAEICGGRLDRI